MHVSFCCVYLAKRYAGKNVSETTHFVGWDVKPQLNQFVIKFHVWMHLMHFCQFAMSDAASESRCCESAQITLCAARSLIGTKLLTSVIQRQVIHACVQTTVTANPRCERSHKIRSHRMRCVALPCVTARNRNETHRNT